MNIMILQYKLRLLAFICFISGRTCQTYAKNFQTENQTKHATDTNHSVIDKAVDPCCFPVHVPVTQPDVHELHVHIHEGKSL